MITSAHNEQIRQVIGLNRSPGERASRGLFAAEGKKMFGEAPKEWIHKVFISETLSRDREFMEKAKAFPYEIVSDGVFQRLCDTSTPQGVLTVLQIPTYSPEEVLKKRNPLVMVLEDLQDPGNVGTIFRTAEAAGADAIFLCGACADVTGPKTVRATMGSIYRMPFFRLEDVSELASIFEGKIAGYAACLGGTCSYDEASYLGGTAFLIGNESRGLSERALSLANMRIRIPMEGRVESLNAAMAAGILMYEAFRQRRAGRKRTKGGMGFWIWK